MAEANKDTIYIDVDDEITSVIEKVRGSEHKIIALVLPKRATVFQSIVNMKLLKRTGDEVGKRIVLITSEAGILPLAGAVGLHVAKTLQTKPYIPAAPDVPGSDVALDEAEESGEEEPDLDSDKPVGELAGAGALASKPSPEETIELDEPDEPDVTAGGKKAKKSKKDKKLKVPDFNQFRTRLLIGIGALVLLIIFWIFASFVLPKAKITIKTDTTTLNSSVPFTANAAVKTLDQANGVVPAESKQAQKTDTQKVSATGQKDIGTPATGTMTVYNCSNNDITLPAGTTFTSGSVSYATNQSVGVPASDFNKGACKKSPSADVAVTATAAGTQFNIGSGQSFSSSYGSSVTGTGSAMTGGTSNVVKVIAQLDIDSAKDKLKNNMDGPATDDLKKALQADKEMPIAETLVPLSQNITTSGKAGDQASDVTVTAVTTYSMLGVKQDDLKTLIEASAKKQIDTSKQNIVSDGLDQPTFQITNKKSPTEQAMTVATTVTAGADINIADLKKQVAGKKKGDVEQLLQGRPGVKDINVELSPFWVGKVPSRTGHVTIVIDKPPAINGNKP